MTQYLLSCSQSVQQDSEKCLFETKYIHQLVKLALKDAFGWKLQNKCNAESLHSQDSDTYTCVATSQGVFTKAFNLTFLPEKCILCNFVIVAIFIYEQLCNYINQFMMWFKPPEVYVVFFQTRSGQLFFMRNWHCCGGLHQ